ncbi:hypothetical protein QR685DRAFT_514012 [Neurospora intermedia]|uniref:Secreted protein n=1 Tax=Neurospora intermedia TaxID=5142 RepID=A0ABR3DVI4_NEUIN
MLAVDVFACRCFCVVLRGALHGVVCSDFHLMSNLDVQFQPDFNFQERVEQTCHPQRPHYDLHVACRLPSVEVLPSPVFSIKATTEYSAG